MSSIQSALLVTALHTPLEPVPLPFPVDPPVCEQPDHADCALLRDLKRDALRLAEELGLHATVTARVKSPDSILAKMHRKGVSYAAITDRLGVRMIVPTEADCYAIRDHLLERFESIPGEYDDYIARPKPNGYQSLHLVVVAGPNREVVEFQLRTPTMHAHAEHGAAAHHVYKQQMFAA